MNCNSGSNSYIQHLDAIIIGKSATVITYQQRKNRQIAQKLKTAHHEYHMSTK
jgi:hypothetical protein